jgi:hypothetical protein
MELLQFILSSAWNFTGTIILIFVSSVCISGILKSFRLFEINRVFKVDDKKNNLQYDADYLKKPGDIKETYIKMSSKSSNDSN